MTKVLFSFDVEDYVNEKAADGILYSVQAMDAAGVRGCFNITARLAEALIKWGRGDIIEALKRHEINLHTLDHSHHPTINEYTDRADYLGALEEFLKREGEAMEILGSVFGPVEPIAACPPGNSVSYVAHYGYAQMGFSVYAGDVPNDGFCGRPMHFCNLLSVGYDLCFEDWIWNLTTEEMKQKLDEMATKDVFTVAHHPAQGVVKEYWDSLNFKNKNTPPEAYRLSAPYPPEKTEGFYRRIREFVQLVKNDPRFEIVTQKQVAKRYMDRDRTVTSSMLPALRDQIREALFPVTLPLSLSLSDIFYACRSFLLGENEHICGDSYGFLEEPFAISKPLSFSAEQFRESAKHVKADGFLPEFVYVDGVKLGPADWMRGALEILCGASEVRIKPAPYQIELWQARGLRNYPTFLKSWVNNPSEFLDSYLSRRGILQSWTIRFPKGTMRMAD